MSKWFGCLFRLQQPRRILLIPVFLQPRETDLQPIVAHLIAEQHIHGGVEKIRKLHDHRQLRLRKPRLPFVDRTDRHAQHLRQLFLGQSPLLAEFPYVLRQFCYHICNPSSSE